LLLAGLYATKGFTNIVEPVKTRDHTERMLALFKSPVEYFGNIISLRAPRDLKTPGTIVIPGDISSAAFFMVAALIIPDSVLVLRNVSTNPTRAGIIAVLKRMGANLRIEKIRTVAGAEPVADIRVTSSKLIGTVVKESEIPLLIDELPILMVAACFAKGVSEFQGVEELRVKETDRIDSMVENLGKMGVRADVKTRRAKNGQREDIVIESGGGGLQGAHVKSFNDHRTAMSMMVAAAAANGTTELDDTACIAKSFPDFEKVFTSVLAKA
jgi:3-phosphoshikimate 1-carboxyvinyltransferase